MINMRAPVLALPLPKSAEGLPPSPHPPVTRPTPRILRHPCFFNSEDATLRNHPTGNLGASNLPVVPMEKNPVMAPADNSDGMIHDPGRTSRIQLCACKRGLHKRSLKS